MLYVVPILKEKNILKELDNPGQNLLYCILHTRDAIKNLTKE